MMDRKKCSLARKIKSLWFKNEWKLPPNFLIRENKLETEKKTPRPMPGASKFAFCWSGRHAKLASDSSLVSGNFQSKTI